MSRGNVRLRGGPHGGSGASSTDDGRSDTRAGHPGWTTDSTAPWLDTRPDTHRDMGGRSRRAHVSSGDMRRSMKSFHGDVR